MSFVFLWFLSRQTLIKMMFEKILAAIDLSDMGKLIFESALSLATQNRAQLLLFHALSPEEENSPLPIPPDLTQIYPAAGNNLTLETWRQQWEEFERTGRETLENYAKKATDAGIEVECHQIIGSPGRKICELAQSQKVGLIVIGHRGRRGLSEFFLGSVSNYVLHHANCSVLMVQPITPV
jgi:nucleotide-binding universal stress UspA family protein